MYNPEYFNKNRKNVRSVSADLENKIKIQNQLIFSLEKQLQLQEELIQLQESRIQDLTEMNEQLDLFMENGEIPTQEHQE